MKCVASLLWIALVAGTAAAQTGNSAGSRAQGCFGIWSDLAADAWTAQDLLAPVASASIRQEAQDYSAVASRIYIEGELASEFCSANYLNAAAKRDAELKAQIKSQQDAQVALVKERLRKELGLDTAGK